MADPSGFVALDHVTPEEDKDVLWGLARKARHNAWRFSNVAECVEVGSWAGSTALVLSDVFDRTFCVDHWRGNPGDRLGEVAARLRPGEAFEVFCSNMGSRLLRSVIPLRGTSAEWFAVWRRDAKVGLVFLDASHDYLDVLHDIAMWRHAVLPGGILCGHDWDVFPGVNRAVLELIPHEHIRHEHNIWWTIIPD